MRVAGQRHVEVAGRRLQDHLGVVRQQKAQGAWPALERREYRRQVVVPALRVVDAGDLDAGVTMRHRHHLVGQQPDAALLHEPRVGGLHERRLAVPVVVVAEHRVHAERRHKAPQLALELGASVRPAGEVAGDEQQVRPRRQRQIDRLAHGAQVEARREAGMEVRELDEGEAVEFRRGIGRRQAPIDTADPLRLVQQIRKTEGGGGAQRRRRPQQIPEQRPQVSRPDRRRARLRRPHPSGCADARASPRSFA